MTQETIIEKIKKLIAKAKGTDNELEANAFMAKANSLLIKHGLESSELENDEKKASFERGIVYGKGSEEGLWEDSLISVISLHNLCEAIIHPSDKEITLIGRRENIEIAKFMFEVARDIIRKGRSKRYSNYKKIIKQEYPELTEKELLKSKKMQYSNPFKRAYLKGAVMGLHAKLTEERSALIKRREDEEKSRNENSSSVSNNTMFALALKDLMLSRKEEINELKEELFSDNIENSTIKLKNSDATRMGVLDGKSIQLSAGITAGSETEIPKLLK